MKHVVEQPERLGNRSCCRGTSEQYTQSEGLVQRNQKRNEKWMGCVAYISKGDRKPNKERGQVDITHLKCTLSTSHLWPKSDAFNPTIKLE